MVRHPSPGANSLSSRPAKRQRLIKSEDEYTKLPSMPPTPESLNSGYPIEDKWPQLAAEQKKAIDSIIRGPNVFLTRGAGSGKTVVLKRVAHELRKRGKRVHICVPSGLAAHGVGATTVHSILGCDPKSLEAPIRRLETKSDMGPFKGGLGAQMSFIIEEISMVENLCFERISWMIRVAKVQATGEDQDLESFGSAQIIVVGDF